MKKELSVKQIFDDFTSKTILNDDEKEVLIRYIKNESIVKMADEMKLGTTTISRIIAELKEKYNNYKKLELAKLQLLKWKWYKSDNLYCFFLCTIKLKEEKDIKPTLLPKIYLFFFFC